MPPALWEGHLLAAAGTRTVGEMDRGNRIVIAGATGSVTLPVTLSLAATHDVWAVARFTVPEARQQLEDAGVRCVPVDLATGDLAGVPDEVDYVLNFSVTKSGDWGNDLDGNAGGVGALMHHCRSARAVLHCSSTAVYQPASGPLAESAPLGDNHRVWSALATYSISKIAAEAMARFCSRHLDLPTTIARLNVPYGACGGWPAMHLDAIVAGHPIAIHSSEPNVFNPIHTDDIVAMLPGLLDAASAPATVVNWGGVEPVSIEEWSAYLGELVGAEPQFVATDQTIQGVEIDPSLMTELVGPTRVGWKEGMRRVAVERHGDRVRSGVGGDRG